MKRYIKKLQCPNCKNASGKIKIKRTYPHGRKSKPLITYLCRSCKLKFYIKYTY